MTIRRVVFILAGWLVADLARGSINPMTPYVVVLAAVIVAYLAYKKYKDGAR